MTTNPAPPTLDAVAATLRFPPEGRAMCAGWDDAMRVPATVALAYLEPGYIARAGVEIGLTDDMIAALTGFASRVLADPALLALFRFAHWRMVTDPEFTNEWDDPWPRLDARLGEEAGLINGLVILSGVPRMQENYRRLGLPADVARDTVGDVARWLANDTYYQRYKKYGITPWIVRWLGRHFEGKIIHLKRLHFTPKRFNGKLRAWRRRRDGVLVAISSPGLRFLADGNAWGPCCGEPAGTWTSTLEETADAVVGNPILPTGLARREPMRLLKAEWDLALAPGDSLLGIHIPTGSPMTFDDCGESFRQGLEFYPKYFPAVQSKGYDTTSWLYDPKLEDILAPESNIVRAMRELFLYPGVSNSNASVFGRVFGWHVTDIKGLPLRNSLEKAVGKFVNGGGHFHGGNCFLLNADVAGWGTQVYRGMVSRY